MQQADSKGMHSHGLEAAKPNPENPKEAADERLQTCMEECACSDPAL